MHAVARLTPQTTDDELLRRAPRGPAPTSTRTASPAGRTRSSARTPAWTTPARRTSAPRARATCSRPRRRRAVVGPRAAARSRSPTSSSGARRYTHGQFRATSVKVMQDGVAENFTAALVAPYLDRCGHATANTGHSFVDPSALRRVRRGCSTPSASRCTCTRSATAARARRSTPSTGTDPERRHHIAHLQLVHPDDVRRFAELGVAANLQMLWACLDEQMVELTLPFLGEERATWQYPFGDLERAGARLVAGSDWPVSTPEPARGDPRRRQPHGVRRGGAGRSRPVPARAGDRARDRVRGVHLRLGVDQPPRRRGRAAPGRGRRPGGARPRPVRGLGRRHRRDPGGVDLDRRDGRLPGLIQRNQCRNAAAPLQIPLSDH